MEKKNLKKQQVSQGRPEAQASTGLALKKTEAPSAPIPKEAACKLIPTLATEEPDLLAFLTVQATNTALPFGDSHHSFNDRFVKAAVRSIGPRDGVEAFLAVQMVHTHNLAIEYMARAAAKTQTTVGIDLFTNFANRLLRTFALQVETLKKYRSKGEQHCIVEHVHVHSGGQAVVGAVTARSRERGVGDKGNGNQ